MKLSELKSGEKGKILAFENSDLELKLMEMGCIPGEEVVVEQKAPFRRSYFHSDSRVFFKPKNK